MAFGPRSFPAGSAQSIVQQTTFQVKNPAVPYTVVARRQPNTSTLVVVNGAIVVGPWDFPGQLTTVQRSVRLQANNTMFLLVVGPRNGGVSIEVDGLDIDLPTITATTTPQPNAAGWNRGNVSVAFTCSDATTSITSCPPPVIISAEGRGQAVTGTATDGAGNSATTKIAVNIDKTAPTVTATAGPPANARGWNNGQVTVSFAATDALSGVAPGSLTGPVSLSADGTNLSASGQATDLAGNVGTANATGVNIDQTVPSGVVTLSPPRPANGIYTTVPVTATFTCQDTGSGIATCPPPQTFSAPGTGLVATGAAMDVAGNLTPLSSSPFTIQLTAPTITVSLTPGANAAGWNNTPITAHFTCLEGGALLPSCPADILVGTEGAAQTVSGSVTSPSGATVSVTSAPFNIDLTPPTIAPSQAPLPNASGWTNVASVTVHFTCADALSGASACSGDQVVNGEGANQRVSGTVTDLAGNVASTSVAVNIDRTPPTVSLLPPANGTSVYMPTPHLTGTASDALSGLASASCNGVPAAVSGSSFSCDVPLSPGSNAVSVVAIDLAGNTNSSSLTLTYTRVPQVTLTAPANAAYLNISPTTVSGTVDDPTAAISVNGIPAVVANGSFSLALPLSEGPNVIAATATSGAGAAGTASIQVTLDTTPPRVTITSPPDLFETTEAAVSVAGIINDIVVGTVNAAQAQVTVNGTPAQVANRTFLADTVPLSIGPNVIRAVGRDRVGNSATTQLTVVRRASSAQPQIHLMSGNNQTAPIRGTVAAPLLVSVTDSAGAPAPNQPVIFKVTQNDGLVATGGTPAPTVAATTDAQGQARVQWTLGGRAGAGSNTVEAYAVGFEGTAIFTATGALGNAGKIVVDTGNNQVGPIGQPLPKPFIAVVIDEGNNRLGGVPVTFTVAQGGGTFGGQESTTVTTDSDGRAWSSLSLGMQEGEANNLVSATFAGNLGSPAAFTASGRAPGDPAHTTISGVILDNSDAPIPGVTVRAVSTNVMTSNGNATQAALSARTNPQGQFSIAPAPVGLVKLVVDGSTATAPGAYPSLEYDTVTVAGQANTVGQPISLLALNTANQLCVTQTTGGGTLTVPDAPGFSLTFGPGQVTFPGGSKAGCVTVSVVHPDKVPMAPGFGQQPRFIVTIQPSGAVFSPPAPITLPNVDGLKPREVTEMYSFDHDISSFVAIGTGTVSDDGLVVRSSAGVGVLKAGWHCGGNAAATGTAANCAVCFFCPGSLSNCQPQGNGVSCGSGGTCQFGRGCVGGGGSCLAGYTFNAAGTQCCQGSTCIQPTCPLGQSFDPSTRLCANNGPCAPGYNLSGGQCCAGGTCVRPSCPSGQVFDPSTGSCQPVLNTCTPQTAGQFCIAGIGASDPGRCDSGGGCVGTGSGQCGVLSGCTACITTAGGGQQCSVCANGQPPVSGQCNAPTIQLTWRGQPINPLVTQVYIRQGTKAYLNSVVGAVASPPGGTFVWTPALSSMLDVKPSSVGDQATVTGLSPGVSDLIATYTLPDGRTTSARVLVHVSYPLILVHGFNSSASAWDGLNAELSSLGLLAGTNYYLLFGDGCWGLQTANTSTSDIDFCAFDYGAGGHGFDEPTQLAVYLSRAIQNVKSATGATKVVILAHSMGGLVSRSYIQEWSAGDVDRLITIGTPHVGTVLADLISDPDVASVTGDPVTEGLRSTVHPSSPAVAGMASRGGLLARLNQPGALPTGSGAPQFVSLVGLADPSWFLVTKHAYEDLWTVACQPGTPFGAACLKLSSYNSQVSQLFLHSDGLVSADSQNIESVFGHLPNTCSQVVAATVEHSPDLYLLEAFANRFGIPGAGLVAKPTETQMTALFVSVLGLRGAPICPR